MIATKIWNEDPHGVDMYLDFKDTFSVTEQGKVTLRLSCDSIFTVALNGEQVGFGSCLNFPDRKEYCSFDLTKSVKSQNELQVTVWHQGIDSQTYVNDDAYLAFEIVQNGKSLLTSGENTQCRVNNHFRQGYAKTITEQMGLSFYYDTTAEELPYRSAISYGKVRSYAKTCKNLSLLSRSPAEIIETENGYLIDLGKETVGFLDLDIECDTEKELLVAYGERLADGKVPRKISRRDFSVEVKLSKGRTHYLNAFRRLAGRWLEIETKDVKIHYLGIRVVEYPTAERNRRFSDPLIQKIYDTCVHTLRCCMHDHYEDCPWREQALYALDSRNQMLCGYYAFRGHEFQKENLILLSASRQRDGLLSICAPSGKNIPIPFFSLIYPMQVYEYVEHTGDRSILGKVGKTVQAIMTAFDNRVEENGLIASLPYPYWNFYEWSTYSENGSDLKRTADDIYQKRYDMILNSAYVYAYSFYDKLFGTSHDLTKTKKAIAETFYNEKTGAFRIRTDGDESSVLVNAFAILIGLGDGKLAEKLTGENDFVPITLSMNTFLYDALLKIDEKYKDWILNDIRRKYTVMLDAGATTFWETEKGWRDFGNAGSLCHGWSAMPLYYFCKWN